MASNAFWDNQFSSLSLPTDDAARVASELVPAFAAFNDHFNLHEISEFTRIPFLDVIHLPLDRAQYILLANRTKVQYLHQYNRLSGAEK